MEKGNVNCVGQEKQSCKLEFPDSEESLLWKLHLRRKEAFQEMNSDVDEIVNRCLKTKKHLETLEDSKRNLKREARSLRTKYEALLEKNKKDTGIIMRLKDSELLLSDVLKKQEEVSELLLNTQIKNKEKTVERNLLEDDRQKLLFKSQTVTNMLRKVNLKHKRIHEKIEDENKKSKENERRFAREIEELKSKLHEDDKILEKWLKYNTLRDAAIRRLQEEIRNGSMMQSETRANVTCNKPSEVDTTSIETETNRSTEEEITEDIKTVEIKGTDPREIAFRQELTRRKTLCEAAERQKEHWMDFYMLLNQRIQDLHIEMVNVRQWRIDKEAEKKELVESAARMEKLVSQKRRNKPVPARSSVDELNIWIKWQRKVNEMLRNSVSRCLSIKTGDSAIYSEFAKSMRNMYLETLEDQISLESEKSTEEKTSTETETNA